jgi:ribokinase
MKFDIISVGSGVIDNFVYTNIHEKEKQISYPIGMKLKVDKIVTCTGGAGTNTSVSFSRLGLKAGFLGKIGNDYNGKIILNELKNEKVPFLGKLDKKMGTGTSIILDSMEHERTILTYKGASEHLKFNEMNRNALNTKWFYFSSLAEDSFQTQKKLAKIAKKKGIKIALNPSSYQAEKGAEYIKDILEVTEILILNKEEAQMLIKKNIVGKELLKELIKLGVKIACVTDGPNGNIVYDGEKFYNSNVHNEIKCVERTGAGDAFAAGFVAGIIKNKGIEFSIQLGSANSESVIQYIGAKNKLLTLNEAEKIIKKNPFKIRKE